MATAIEGQQRSLPSAPKASIGSLCAVDVMSAPVVSVQADCSLLAAWDVLRSHRVQHLVVMDGTRVAGVVDEADILLAWSAAPLGQSGTAVRKLLRARVRRV